MPLNSSHLQNPIINILRDLPEDESCCDTTPYQTKVSIYDSKCKGCQFVRIEARPENAWNGNGIKVFTDIDKAIEYATDHADHRIILKRLCSYPNDLTYRNGKTIYPNLTEIVSNSCEMWDETKMLNLAKEETEYLELDNVEGLIGLPEIRCI